MKMFLLPIDKLKVHDEILIGRKITKIKTMKTEDILRIIEQDEYITNFSNTYDIK